MAWAIFHQESNWSRPQSRFSFNAKASSTPQERPQDFIDYCVGRGWAKWVPSPNKNAANSLRKVGKKPI